MKKFIKSWGGILAALALFIGVTSVNSPSAILYYQPKVPEAMNRFKK